MFNTEFRRATPRNRRLKSRGLTLSTWMRRGDDRSCAAERVVIVSQLFFHYRPLEVSASQLSSEFLCGSSSCSAAIDYSEIASSISIFTSESPDSFDSLSSFISLSSSTSLSSSVSSPSESPSPSQNCPAVSSIRMPMANSAVSSRLSQSCPPPSSVALA